MKLGPDTDHSDIHLMLEQLESLRSSIAEGGTSSTSITDRMNTALSKLPSDSPLHGRWQKTRSLYDEVVALINLRRSDLSEARTPSALGERDSREKTDTPACRRPANVSSRSSMRTQSGAGVQSVPVCHVKPTQVSNESNSTPSTTPFNLRNYLIDKNVPVTEPVFRPQVSSVVQDRVVKSSSEVLQKGSADEGALWRGSAKEGPLRRGSALRSTQPAVKSSVPLTTPTQLPMRSRLKAWKKKAVGLLTDGPRAVHSPSQADHGTARSSAANSLARLEYCHCFLALNNQFLGIKYCFED